MDALLDLLTFLGGPQRVAAAGGVVAAYASFCAGFWRRQRRARLRMASLSSPEGADAVLVAFASQTGTAEALAARTAESLRAAGRAAHLVRFDALDRERCASGTALFIVSTTGEGDAPDCAAKFQRLMTTAGPPLERLRYGVLALGDRSYAHYCAFGFALDAWLGKQQAQPLFPVIDVDDGDAHALARWQQQVAALGGQTTDGIWPDAPFERWRVAERRLLNAGSPGGPAFHVALELPDGDRTWSAGDIAEIVPSVPAARMPAAASVTREYSIASVPSDGRVELLVRQVRRDDGTLGLGSGWLTAQVPVGGEVWLRIRSNRAFHPPDRDRPLVLIGNGTGLAGLRAHLKARAEDGAGPNWLLFGERTSAHDAFHCDELAAWRRSGVLERCDLAFSRDAGALYVQDLLLREESLVRRWAEKGAAFYVCGSRAGMAAGVGAALTSILGDGGVRVLTEEGRYRRDVY